MNTGGLFQPDMLLQMMQRDEILREFIYSYQNEKILPWYLEILELAQRNNEINPHLTKEMMLLYIQMFTKLGDDFGAQLLEGDAKNIFKILSLCFLWSFCSTKIKRHPYVKYI